MKRKINLIMIVIISILIIVTGFGCESSDNDNKVVSGNETDNSPDNDMEEPIEIIIGEGTDFIGGFNALSDNDGNGFAKYISNVYETLVIYDKGEIKAGLAESWEVKDNKIIFNLRKGIMFTDGQELKADVVKTGFEYMKETLGEQLAWIIGVSKLQEINVIDDYKVEFVYDTPYIGALQDLTVAYRMAIMSPSVFVDGEITPDVNTMSFGTGPYKVSEVKQGQYYVFVKNEDYWGEKPKIDKITIKIIPGMESRMMALQSEEIDLVYGVNDVSLDAYNQFSKDNKFKTKVAEDVFATRNILLNTTKEPFNDINVRMAAQHAVNKDSICKNLLFDMEEKADYLLNRYLPYCDVEVKPYNFDLDKSRQLLEEAGWKDTNNDGILEKNGKNLEGEILFRTGWGMEEDICQVLSGQLREVGFDIKTTGMEMMSWYSKVLEGDFQATVNDTYGVPYDPYTFLSPMLNYSADNPAQQGLEQKPQIDEEIENIFNTVDDEEIRKSFEYVLKTLHEQALNLSISYTKDPIIYNPEKMSDYEFGKQTREFYFDGIIK